MIFVVWISGGVGATACVHAPSSPDDFLLLLSYYYNSLLVCGAGGSILTCQSLIRHVVGHGVEEEDRKDTWLEDAEHCTQQGAHECARAVYAHSLSIFPNKKSIWLQAAFFEKVKG